MAIAIQELNRPIHSWRELIYGQTSQASGLHIDHPYARDLGRCGFTNNTELKALANISQLPREEKIRLGLISLVRERIGLIEDQLDALEEEWGRGRLSDDQYCIKRYPLLKRLKAMQSPRGRR